MFRGTALLPEQSQSLKAAPMRRHCNSCGHWHGTENCTAIRYDTDDHASRCGCQEHNAQRG